MVDAARVKALVRDAASPLSPYRAGAQQQLDAFRRESPEAVAICTWMLGNDRGDEALVFFCLQVVMDRWEFDNQRRSQLRQVLLELVQADSRMPVVRKAASALIAIALRDWPAEQWPEFGSQVCALAKAGRVCVLQVACESMRDKSALLDSKLNQAAFQWEACLRELLSMAAPSLDVLEALFALYEWAPPQLCYSAVVVSRLFELAQSPNNSQLACLAVSTLSQVIRRKWVPPDALGFVLELGSRTMSLLVYLNLNKTQYDEDLASCMAEFVASFIREHMGRIEQVPVQNFSMERLLSQFFEFTMSLKSSAPLLQALEVWESYVSHVAEVESEKQSRNEPGGHPFAPHLGGLVLALSDLFLYSKSRSQLIHRLQASSEICSDEPGECDLFALLDHVVALAGQVASLEQSDMVCVAPVLNRMYPGLMQSLSDLENNASDEVAWDVAVHLMLIANIAHVFAKLELARNDENNMKCLQMANNCLALAGFLASPPLSATSPKRSMAKAGSIKCLAGMLKWMHQVGAQEVEARALAAAVSSLQWPGQLNRIYQCSVDLLSLASAPLVVQCIDAAPNLFTGEVPLRPPTRTQLVTLMSGKVFALQLADAGQVQTRLAGLLVPGTVDVAGLLGLVQAATDQPNKAASVYNVIANGPLDGLLNGIANRALSPYKLEEALDCLGSIVVTFRRHLGGPGCARVAERLLEALRNGDALRDALPNALRVLQAMVAEPSPALNALLVPMLDLVLTQLTPPAKESGAYGDVLGMVSAVLTVHWRWFLLSGSAPSQVRQKELDPAKADLFYRVLRSIVETLDLNCPPSDLAAALQGLSALNEQHNIFSQAFFAPVREETTTRLVLLLKSHERDILQDDIISALHKVALADLPRFCTFVGWSSTLVEELKSEQDFAKVVVQILC